MVERMAGRIDTVLSSGLPRLPNELVYTILGYLSSNQLWPVAAVSRTLYAAAWRAGMFIHRTIYLSAHLGTPRLGLVDEVIQHTLSKKLNLGLTLICDPYNADFKMQLEMQTILSTVTTALPVLIHLYVDLPDYALRDLAVALSHGAPQLRLLSLEQSWSRPDSQPRPASVPSDLFSGHAPQLRKVTLRNVALGDHPIAAFSRVTYAVLDYCGILPDGPLLAHFPRLSSLRLTCCEPKHGPLPAGFSLRGMDLRRLCVDDSGRKFQPFQFDPVPDLERICHLDWTEPLWLQNNPDRLKVLIQNRQLDGMSIIVVPSHRRWRRAFHISRRVFTCPLANMPGANERVTHLHLDNIYLIGLLEADQLRLDALCELRVDFPAASSFPELIWPPDYAAELRFSPRGPPSAPAFPTPEVGGCYLLSCRSLRTLKLFARGDRVTVDSAEVAFLAHALGQSLRPQNERPILELSGVGCKVPIARSLLEETFSGVLLRDLVGRASDEHDEDGMWSGWLSEE